MDRRQDREVVLRRIGKNLKFRGVLDQFVGSLALGCIAGIGGTVVIKRWPGGSLADAAEWFFRNATELNLWFALLTIGVASALVGSHVELKRQGWVKRLLFLPFIRMTGDALLLAFAAFLSAALVALAVGPSILGEGKSAVFIEGTSMMKDAALFGLLAAYVTACRLVVESVLDDALFRLVNSRDPGLRSTLKWVGWSGFVTFSLVMCFLIWAAD